MYGYLTLVILMQQGPSLHSSIQGGGEGGYCTKSHNHCEQKHPGGHQGRPNPFPGCLTGLISPR